MKGAPAALDTMKEISNVIAKEDADLTTALQTVLTGYKNDESSAKETFGNNWMTKKRRRIGALAYVAYSGEYPGRFI